jgi:hypothetical protein
MTVFPCVSNDLALRFQNEEHSPAQVQSYVNSMLSNGRIPPDLFYRDVCTFKPSYKKDRLGRDTTELSSQYISGLENAVRNNYKALNLFLDNNINPGLARFPGFSSSGTSLADALAKIQSRAAVVATGSAEAGANALRLSQEAQAATTTAAAVAAVTESEKKKTNTILLVGVLGGLGLAGYLVYNSTRKNKRK